MKKETYTDEQLWDEVLEVLHDNRRELTDEEVEALLHERKTIPLRYVLLAAAAALAVGLFLWTGTSDSPPALPVREGAITLANGNENEIGQVTAPSLTGGSKPALGPSGRSTLGEQSVLAGETAEVAVRHQVSATRPKKSPVAQAPAPSPQAATEEQPEVELLDIDMEAVQQRGEDLRLAMAVMNQELFEMN